MGITPSTGKPEVFNLRSDQFPWEKLRSTNRKSLSEKEGAEIQAIAEAAYEQVMRELDALLPPKLGESSSTDQPKELSPEWDEKVSARFAEFMKGGACKESYKAFEDCLEQNDRISNCNQHFPVLIKCVDAHADYYQPIIALAESNVNQFLTETEEFVRRNQDGDD